MPALTHGRVINGFNSLPRSIESEKGSNGKSQPCCGKPIQRLKYRSTRKSLLRVSSKSSNKKYASNVIIGRSYAAKRAISRRVTNKKPIRNSTGEKIGWEICCKDPVETIIYEIPIFTSLAIFSAPAVSGTIIGTVTAISRRNEILTFSIENSSELVITPGGVLSFASPSSFTRKELYYATITVSNGDRISTQDIVVNELPLFTSLAIFSAPAVSGATIGTVTATTSGNEILTFSIENSSELVITPGGVLSFTSSSFTRKESFVATITVSNGDRISTQDIVVENTAWGTITGRVIDGYLNGAKVFVDVNGDGVHNPDEPITTTNPDGSFEFEAPMNGTIIAYGGIDISTGKEFTGELKAPPGSEVVTPLTTLVNAVMKQLEVDSTVAVAAVKVALALKPDSEILEEDPIKTGSESLNKAAAQVANIISLATEDNSALQKVTTAIAQANELGVQTNILSNEEALTELFGSAVEGKAIARINDGIRTAPDYKAIARLQTIELADIVEDLEKKTDLADSEFEDIISKAAAAATADYEEYFETIVEPLPELVEDEDTSTITLSPTVVNAAQNNPELENAIEAAKIGKINIVEVEDYVRDVNNSTTEAEKQEAQNAFSLVIQDLPQYIVGEPAGFTNALNAVRQYLPSEFQPTDVINPVLKLQENGDENWKILSSNDQIIGRVRIATYPSEYSEDGYNNITKTYFPIKHTSVNVSFYFYYADGLPLAGSHTITETKTKDDDTSVSYTQTRIVGSLYKDKYNTEDWSELPELSYLNAVDNEQALLTTQIESSLFDNNNYFDSTDDGFFKVEKREGYSNIDYYSTDRVYQGTARIEQGLVTFTQWTDTYLIKTDFLPLTLGNIETDVPGFTDAWGAVSDYVSYQNTANLKFVVQKYDWETKIYIFDKEEVFIGYVNKNTYTNEYSYDKYHGINGNNVRVNQTTVGVNFRFFDNDNTRLASNNATTYTLTKDDDTSVSYTQTETMGYLYKDNFDDDGKEWSQLPELSYLNAVDNEQALLTTRIESLIIDNQYEFVDDVNGFFKAEEREGYSNIQYSSLTRVYQGMARIEQGLVTFTSQWTDTYTETYLIKTDFLPLTLGNIETDVPGFTDAWGAVSVSYQNTANLKFVVQKYDWETKIYIFDKEEVFIGYVNKNTYTNEYSYDRYNGINGNNVRVNQTNVDVNFRFFDNDNTLLARNNATTYTLTKDDDTSVSYTQTETRNYLYKDNFDDDGKEWSQLPELSYLNAVDFDRALLTTQIESSLFDNNNYFDSTDDGFFKVEEREGYSNIDYYSTDRVYQGMARIEQGLVTFTSQWTDTYTETYLIETDFLPLTLDNIETEVPGFTDAWGAVSDYVSYQNTANLKFVVQKYDWGTDIYIFDKEEVFIGNVNKNTYPSEYSEDGYNNITKTYFPIKHTSVNVSFYFYYADGLPLAGSHTITETKTKDDDTSVSYTQTRITWSLYKDKYNTEDWSELPELSYLNAVDNEQALLTTQIESFISDNNNYFDSTDDGFFSVKEENLNLRFIDYYSTDRVYQGMARIEQGLVTFTSDTYTETYLIKTDFLPLTLDNIETEVPGFTDAWGAVSDYVSYQNTANLKFVVQKYDWGTDIYIFDKEEVFIGICNQRDNIIETSGEKKMTVEFSFLTINMDFQVGYRKETMINESGETLDMSPIVEKTDFNLYKNQLSEDAWEIYKIKYNLNLLNQEEITEYNWSEITGIAGNKTEQKSQNGDSESVVEINYYYKEGDERRPFVKVEYDNNKITIYDKDNNQIYTENYDKIADAKMLKDTIENITTKRRITLKNDITIQSKLTIPKISGLKLIIEKGKILTVKKPSTDPIIITENVKQNIIITKERTITIEDDTVVKDLTIPEDTTITISNDKVLTVVNNDNNVSDIFQGVKTELGNVYSANPGDGSRRNDVSWGIKVSNPTLMNQNNININNNGEITFTPPVTFNKPSLNFTITATDSEKSSTQEITVNVLYLKIEDTIAPVITLVGSSEMYHEAKTPFADPGATATDNMDGLVPVTTNGMVDIHNLGSYKLTYKAIDKAGNAAAQLTRTVVVNDTMAPVITLVGSSEMYHEANTDFTDPGAKATDNMDGSVSVTTKGEVDTHNLGSYKLTYDAIDKAGNAAEQLTRTVVVNDTMAPVITLVGSSEMYHEANIVFVDPGATATDNMDGSVSVTTNGEVDIHNLGSYKLTYKAIDKAGNAAAQLTRAVVVNDTMAPVITLVGESEITHIAGTDYTDLGAEVINNSNTDFSRLNLTGEVNTDKLGVYTLSYSAKDSSGNEATPVERKVTVTDGLEVIQITSTSTQISENGGSCDITVYLSQPALAENMLLSVVATPASRVKVPDTFPVFRGIEKIEFTVESLDDPDSNGDEIVSIQLKTAYRNLGEPIKITIQDDDLEAPVAGTVAD